MSDVTRILSNFKLFSGKEQIEEQTYVGQRYKPVINTTNIIVVIIVLVLGWGFYTYRSDISPFFNRVVDKIRLSTYLTPKGEIATTQIPLDMNILNSVAKSLGIVTKESMAEASASASASQ